MYHETFGSNGVEDVFDWDDIAIVIEDTAKHFAQWQKEQMMKDAVNARIIAIGQNAVVKEENEDDFRKCLSKFQDGDNVKVIIIKE